MSNHDRKITSTDYQIGLDSPSNSKREVFNRMANFLKILPPSRATYCLFYRVRQGSRNVSTVFTNQNRNLSIRGYQSVKACTNLQCIRVGERISIRYGIGQNVTRYFPIMPSDTSSPLTLSKFFYSIWSVGGNRSEQVTRRCLIIADTRRYHCRCMYVCKPQYSVHYIHTSSSSHQRRHWPHYRTASTTSQSFLSHFYTDSMVHKSIVDQI